MKLTRTLALSLVVAMSMPTLALAANTSTTSNATTPSVTATNPTVDATNPVNADDTVVPATSVQESGTVTEVDTTNNTVTIQTADKKETIVLTTDKDTYFVDNTTQKANAIKDIKKGETIYVWHNLAMTRSMPPQTHAQVIISNVKADATYGQLYEVIDSEKNSDGGYVLFNNDRNLYATLPKTIDKVPVYNSDTTLAAAEIKPGTKLIVWYQVVLTSFPGQTTLQSAMALPYSYDGYVSVLNDNKVVVDGKTMQKTSTTKSNDVFVPIIEITRAWGYKSTWNSKTGTLTLKKDTNTIVFIKGSSSFTVNNEKYDIAAPFINQKTLYVPISAIDFIGNYKTVIPMSVV